MLHTVRPDPHQSAAAHHGRPERSERLERSLRFEVTPWVTPLELDLCLDLCALLATKSFGCLLLQARRAAPLRPYGSAAAPGRRDGGVLLRRWFLCHRRTHVQTLRGPIAHRRQLILSQRCSIPSFSVSVALCLVQLRSHGTMHSLVSSPGPPASEYPGKLIYQNLSFISSKLSSPGVNEMAVRARLSRNYVVREVQAIIKVKLVNLTFGAFGVSSPLFPVRNKRYQQS